MKEKIHTPLFPSLCCRKIYQGSRSIYIKDGNLADFSLLNNFMCSQAITKFSERFSMCFNRVVQIKCCFPFYQVSTTLTKLKENFTRLNYWHNSFKIALSAAQIRPQTKLIKLLHYMIT